MAKATRLAAQESAGLPPRGDPGRGLVSRQPRTAPPSEEPWAAPPPGPRSLVLPWALCLSGGGRPAGKCGPRENARSSGWQGERPVPRTRPQGTREPGLTPQGWVKWPRGRLQEGGPALPRPSPAGQPETSQPLLGGRPSPGGLPPVLPSVRGVPLTDGRTGRSSQWWGRDGGVCGFAAT